MTLIARAAAAASLLLCFSMPALAQVSPASNLERSQIEAIIRDYLNKNPEVVIEAIEKWQTQEEERASERAKEAIGELAKITADDPHIYVAGNPDGDVTLYEFFDYKCGYCKRSLPDLMKLIRDDKNIRLVLIELPILSEESHIAASAAIAAIEQDKYFELHTALMQTRGQLTEPVVMQVAREVGLDTKKLASDMRAKPVQQSIERNRSLAIALGVRGTPGFIIGDKIIPGAVGIDQLKDEAAAVRESAKSDDKSDG